jgi:hypothetical protein
MEVGAGFEAMTAASSRFANACQRVEEIERSVQHACALAATATGDPGAAAEMVRFSDRMSVAMDDTARRLLDVAGGLRTALDALWTAAGGNPGGAGSPGDAGPRAPRRPGEPR